MKSTFLNMVSIVMALLVLLSTSSFTVDKHFCGGVLMDVAVLAKAEKCSMSLHSHSDSADEASAPGNCCSNESATVEGQDELKPSLEVYDLEQFLFVCGFLGSSLRFNKELLQQEEVLLAYSPPSLVSDIRLRYQVFLI